MEAKRAAQILKEELFVAPVMQPMLFPCTSRHYGIKTVVFIFCFTLFQFYSWNFSCLVFGSLRISSSTFPLLSLLRTAAFSVFLKREREGGRGRGVEGERERERETEGRKKGGAALAARPSPRGERESLHENWVIAFLSQ